MPQVWPVTLPAGPLIEGYQETAPNNSIRTQMDVGPAKMRQRATAGVRVYNAVWLFTKAQVADFDTFYNDTLEGGTLAFELADPRTGSTLDFRFTIQPVYQSLSDNLWRVTTVMEVLP